MEHSVEIHKLAPKVSELCYDETAPQQTTKTCKAKCIMACVWGTASEFGSSNVGIAVASAGKLMHFIGSSLVNVLKIKHSYNGAKMFDTTTHHVLYGKSGKLKEISRELCKVGWPVQ